MVCPECGKRIEIPVCVGPHPRYRHIRSVRVTEEEEAHFRFLQELDRKERYRR